MDKTTEGLMFEIKELLEDQLTVCLELYQRSNKIGTFEEFMSDWCDLLIDHSRQFDERD